MTNSVEHPSHYNQYEGLEVWDLVELMSFNLGNAVKYITRAGFKDPMKETEDLRKAVFYIQREAARRFKARADYENYGVIVRLLCSQLSPNRAYAIRYVCRQDNESLTLAIKHLEDEIKEVEACSD